MTIYEFAHEEVYVKVFNFCEDNMSRKVPLGKRYRVSAQVVRNINDEITS
jgi:hypothetical protein